MVAMMCPMNKQALHPEDLSWMRSITWIAIAALTVVFWILVAGAVISMMR